MPSDHISSPTQSGKRGKLLIEIPGYEVREKLVENGPFMIYRGRRSEDLAPVLLKVLNRPFPTPKYLAPLWQEFEILRLLDFPGLEKAYSLENHQQWWMIILADGGGQPVDQLEIAGRMQPGEFLHLAIQLTQTLERIHARQVIHKNISPANIYFNPSDGQVTLTNFGYASLVSRVRVPLQNPNKLAEFLAYTSPELTGRMNRSVDYRTDYYSLGATLYELLTGTPPFPSGSPLELVHAHLALLPDPPQDRIKPWNSSPAAFEIISEILLKLLAKNPVDRYQTSAALQADLHHCITVLEARGEDPSKTSRFIPGQFDRPVELHVLQSITGRKEETETLVKAFERTMDGPKELILISGEAGIGKTALANQLIPPVSESSGLFLYGRFDKISHLNIYRALIEIMEDFCRLVVSEPTPSFENWRDRIQIAVAPNGKLLTDLCPQLEKVIGPQPPVRPVDETLVRPRFHRVVIRFLQALCQPDRPVVLVLDDMQWITADSSLLWQAILSNSSLRNLLVVGAYRDTEVDSNHPVYNLLREMEKTGERVTEIRIENLEWPLVQVLIADTLSSSLAEVSELTTLIYMRTKGNPSFSIEFLKSLYQEHLLTLDPVENKWNWDTDKIKEYGIASNAVDFYIRRIAALDEGAQKILQLAALIGNRFQTSTLLAVAGHALAEKLTNSLWQAMRENLIRPLDENYRLLAHETPDAFRVESAEYVPSLADLLEEQILFEFADDQIHQAIISMLDEQELKSTSLLIGWRLLEKADQAGHETLQRNLFSIVDHLNTGRGLITDPGEMIRAAQLNLRASEMSRSLAAFKSASYYLSTGIQLLPQNSWDEQYFLTMELYTAAAEISLINGEFSQAEDLVLVAENNAHTMLEIVRSISVHMDVYLLRNQLDQVIELGIAAIRLLEFDLEVERREAWSIEQMIRLDEMTDVRALAICRMIEALISAAFARNTVWLNQFIDFYLDLFSRYGNPPAASFIYIAYAVPLLGRFDDVQPACRIGKMALEMAEKQGPSRNLYAVRFVYYAFIHHWLAPSKDGILPLEENIQVAFEAGNPRFSLFSQEISLQNTLFAGYNLERVRLNHEEALGQLERHNLASYRIVIWLDMVQKLISDQLDSHDLYLSKAYEEKRLQEAGQNEINKFNLFLARGFLSLILRKKQQALNAAVSADEIIVSTTQLIRAQHVFLHSLALLSSGLDESDLPSRLAKVEENLRLMRLWAVLVPQNYLHQLNLVEAELARCLGRDEQAVRNYEQAIQNARRNGYIHESALAAELAAEYFLAREQYPTCIDYLCTAYYAYLAWGATAKLADLTERYPEWLPPGKDNEKRKVASAEEHTTDELNSSIDLNTILQASVELAQETNLEKLLQKMMSILIENAGAQNGSLILIQNDRWVLKVQGSTDQENGFAMLSTPLEYLSPQIGKYYLPISIIHYVINLKTDLVLEDATTSRQFNRDAYIQSRRPKSILCAPLMNQGVLTGVIYLENNLTTEHVTSNRLEMVRLISSQAAVSIEKARLYETMELQVQERTRELSDANRRLKEEIGQRIWIEEALRLSEARYRTVFENTGTAMALTDEDGYILLINEKYIELTGYSREELENHFNTLDIISPSDSERILHFRQEVMADPIKVPYSFEFELVDKSGAQKPVIATTAFLPGSQSMIASLIDITQRKAVEDALRYNEALLRKVLENLPVGIWILDKYARIISTNPEGERIWSGTNYVEPERFGEYRAWRVEDGKRVDANEWAAIRAVTNGQTTLNEEFEIEAFDGAHRFILNSAMPLETEEDGLVGAIVVNQDITQRKQNEEELQTAHDQLSTLLEISQSIVSTLDLDRLLNMIIEQLGKVMPYEASAILILEQNQMKFRTIRGPAVFQRLLDFQIPSIDLTLIEPLLNRNETIYLGDLQTDPDVIDEIQRTIKLPASTFAYLRSWLVLPLIAKGNLMGCLVLTHSRPDFYSPPAQIISQAYANQVAIAIHNAQLYKQAGDNAATEERNRLARELHDSVAQALYSISLFIDATRMALKMNKPQVVENHLEELSLLSREAMSDMRLLIFELRPLILERVGLVNALQARLDAVESRAGFQATFHSEGTLHLSSKEEGELYRIAQEALNNVIKHAQAHQVSVHLVAGEGVVRITIEDDGIGFDLDKAENGGGQGFRSMRERAANIGASFSFESIPGKGTKITVEMKQ